MENEPLVDWLLKVQDSGTVTDTPPRLPLETLNNAFFNPTTPSLLKRAKQLRRSCITPEARVRDLTLIGNIVAQREHNWMRKLPQSLHVGGAPLATAPTSKPRCPSLTSWSSSSLRKRFYDHIGPQFRYFTVCHSCHR